MVGGWACRTVLGASFVPLAAALPGWLPACTVHLITWHSGASSCCVALSSPQIKEQYLECLKANGSDSEACRELAKAYLKCRMER